MAGPTTLEPSPIDIGAVTQAAFAVTPNPKTLFAKRAARFEALAGGHPLEQYLRFLAAIAQAQSDIQDGLPEPQPPQAEALERAYEFGMPPIDRSRFDVDAVALETLGRLLDRAASIAMPAEAAAARDNLIAADAQTRIALMTDALESAATADQLAEHVFASAALQVHFARLASRIGATKLASVGAGACPCCGGPPVSSIVVGWAAAHGVRYVSCALCATLWNHVRIKCIVCDETTSVAYQTLSEDGETLAEAPTPRARKDEATVKAETCDACKCYVKIFHQHLDPAMDPVADDVASLGLDLKVREAGWARAAFNPYLLGY